MARDASQPGADMDEINARISCLRDEEIYSEQEFAVFIDAYNRGLANHEP